MQIILNDDSCIKLDSVNNPVQKELESMFKHLQHVPLEFKPWDNPYYLSTISYDNLIEQLIVYADKLKIVVDNTRCMNKDDAYFNELHKIFEKNYNGDPAWMDYHENIHLCQRYFYKDKNCIAILDWREKAGLLIKEFDISWYRHSTTKIKQGDVYVGWSELGKTPYQYWLEKEPNDPSRINGVIKPWSKLKPKLTVAMRDMDLLDLPTEFNEWWIKNKDEWCKQQKLEYWSMEYLGVIVVYKLNDFEKFDFALRTHNIPKKISL